MNEEARTIYGDEFVDAVAAVRFYRDFATEEQAIHHELERLFREKFDAVEQWAAGNGSRRVHEHAWRIQDTFFGALDFRDELAAYGRLHRLLADVMAREAA